MGLQTLDENAQAVYPLPMLNPPAPMPLLAPEPPPSLCMTAPDVPGPLEFDPVNPFGSAAVKQQRSRNTGSRRSGPLRPALPPQPHKVDRAMVWGNVLMSVATAYVSTAAAIVPIVLAGGAVSGT